MLREKELNFYKSKGYIILKKFFPKNKILYSKKEINRIIKDKNNGTHFYYENIGGRKVMRRIEKITEYSKHIKRILGDRKLKFILKQVSTKKSYLFKDKLNFKYPGAGGFDPHIDGHFYWTSKDNKLKKGWKEYSNSFTNVVIALEKSNIKNGCIYVSNKENVYKVLGKTWEEISKKIEKFTPKIKKKYLKKIKFKPMVLNVGDVMLFDWKVPHYSRKNNSNSSRMIFYATFLNSNIYQKNLRKKYYLDKDKSKNPLKNKSLI